MEYPYNQNKRSEGMAIAAMVLGIIGTATGCCVYTGIGCGALAIILALLSRGGEMTLSPKAKAGLWLGIAGIVLGIFIYVIYFIFTILQFGSFENYMNESMKLYNDLLEQYNQLP